MDSARGHGSRCKPRSDAAGGSTVGGDGGIVRGWRGDPRAGNYDGAVEAQELVVFECGREIFRCETFKVQGLGATGGSSDECDVSTGDVEGFGEEGDERGVGSAVSGRGGEGDFQCAVVGAGDDVAASTGMDAYGEIAASGSGAQREAHA